MLTAIRMKVSGVALGVRPNAALPRTTFCLPCFAHSGQWNPTEAWCMHAGQIGLSQRWQTTPARRSEWKAQNGRVSMSLTATNGIGPRRRTGAAASLRADWETDVSTTGD